MENTAGYTRAQLLLKGESDVTDFVSLINRECPVDKLILENKDGSLRINPRSVLGVLYALGDFRDEMFLVNASNDGIYPAGISKFRANY